jgi:hypothetical protein
MNEEVTNPAMRTLLSSWPAKDIGSSECLAADHDTTDDGAQRRLTGGSAAIRPTRKYVLTTGAQL